MRAHAGWVRLTFAGRPAPVYRLYTGGIQPRASAATVHLRAAVFDTPTGRGFLASCVPTRGLPLSTSGCEVYGPLGVKLPVHELQPRIPAGGLAFSHRGQYLCVFYGQDPAWPVDYIGHVEGDYEALKQGTWKTLCVEADAEADGGGPRG